MDEAPLLNINQLSQLAAKLRENHEFMAWILATYQRIEHIDGNHFIAQLRITPEMFVRLALCKCPNPNSDTFASQVRKIASYTNIDPTDLANVIRQVDSQNALLKLPRRSEEINRSERKYSARLLAATRDKTEKEESENGERNNESESKSGGNNVAG